MKTRQQTKLIMAALVGAIMFCGCVSPIQKTGYLSDYSRLVKEDRQSK